METLRWAISLLIVVCVFLSFRFVIYFFMKTSLKRWSRLENNEQLMMEKDLDLQVFLRKKTVHGHVVDRGYICQGKLVLTNRRFFAVTHRGLLLEITHEKKGIVKALGPGRLLLKGLGPEGLEVRIEVATEDEYLWEQETASLTGAE